MIIPNIWKNKTCSKPPTRNWLCDFLCIWQLLANMVCCPKSNRRSRNQDFNLYFLFIFSIQSHQKNTSMDPDMPLNIVNSSKPILLLVIYIYIYSDFTFYPCKIPVKNMFTWENTSKTHEIHNFCW